MKKYLIISLVLGCNLIANAQNDLKKKIADSTCACLNSVPNIEKKTQSELQLAIGQCMMQKSLNDFMALAQERNIEMTDQEGMQKLGIEIGMELMKSDCKAMTTIMQKMSASKAEVVTSSDVKNEIKIKGLVQNVSIKNIAYITVVENSKSTQLVWSDYVENGNEFTKDLSKLKNKNFSFKYISKEIYNTATKTYNTVKMITAIN